MVLVISLCTNNVQAAVTSVSKPTSVWDWSQGYDDLNGAADYQSLYSDYLYTDVSAMSIYMENLSSKYELSFAVYSLEPWYTSDIRVFYATVPVGGSIGRMISGLYSGKEYYVIVFAPCKFTGHVSKIY